MKFDVSRLIPEKNFFIKGMSYIGAPRPNTAMYISKKVERLLGSLETVDNCLVFVEDGIQTTEALEKKHAFYFTANPQLEYARFAQLLEDERNAEDAKMKFVLTAGGYYKSESAVVGQNAYIEPGCVIGHRVKIGKNARILSGTVIRNAEIGDNFLANEFAVIGANGFNMAVDEGGNKLRIPTLGRVIIGDYVEVGAHNNISCGSGGDTILEDYVKTDALVHIGHDVHLHKNVEITAGAVIGGFAELGEHAYIGINAVIRNRISIGPHAFVGMGANVTKAVDANVIVAGNPAKPFEKNK